jgi:hypothetical protein
MLGVVYFIKSPAGLIKIGRSKDMKRRLVQFRRSYGEGLEVIALVRGGAFLEAELHRDFASDRQHGEWFLDSDRLRARITDLASADAATRETEESFAYAWDNRLNAQTFLSSLANRIVADRPASVPKLIAVENLATSLGSSEGWLRRLLGNPASVTADADFMLRLVELYEVHCLDAAADAERRLACLKAEAAAARDWTERYGLGSAHASVVDEDGQ